MFRATKTPKTRYSMLCLELHGTLIGSFRAALLLTTIDHIGCLMSLGKPSTEECAMEWSHGQRDSLAPVAVPLASLSSGDLKVAFVNNKPCIRQKPQALVGGRLFSKM